jgi:hypothetical protein
MDYPTYSSIEQMCVVTCGYSFLSWLHNVTLYLIIQQ